MKRCTEQGLWGLGESRASMAPPRGTWSYHPPSHMRVFTNQEAPPKPVSKAFTGASLLGMID